MASTLCLRSRSGTSEIAELIPVLYVVFLLTLVPLINLVALLAGAAIEYLAANDIVAKASTQANYSSALTTMYSEANQFDSFGLAKFVNLTPEGGFTGCGDNLYVLTTDSSTGQITTSAADEPPTAASSSSAVYEMSITSTYRIAPLISLSSFPPLAGVPGLGAPVTLSFSASRPVEHPAGLVVSADNNSSSQTVTLFNRVVVAAPGNVTAPIANSTWRTPDIFAQIQSAGQTVVSVNVFPVLASNPTWTPSGVTAHPGQQLWIDTQAVGTWALTGRDEFTDANGIPGGDFTTPALAPDLTAVPSALVGEIGNTSTASNPAAFLVGDTQTNYPVTGTGELAMMANSVPALFNNAPSPDGTLNGPPLGAQLVRVILTQ